MKRAVISGLVACEMTGASAFSVILPRPLSQAKLGQSPHTHPHHAHFHRSTAATSPQAAWKARMITPPASRNRRICSVPRGGTAEGSVSGPSGKDDTRDAGFVFPLFIISAIFNRILYRVQLVPMRDFTYFLSQFSCCCYVLVYGIILARRIRSGAVSSEMLTYARNNAAVFGVIGSLEALTFLLALYSAARLPGGLIGVLGQGGLLFSVLFSRVFLKTRFDVLQKLGVAVVVLGVLCCTYPQAAASGTLSAAASVELWQNAGLYSAAMALTAAAVTLKQKALQEANLDVIVVSAFGSVAQFVATLALLPITLSFATSLPPAQYLELGLAAFLGGTSPAMPWLALAYMSANIVLNLSAIALVKRGGAVGTMVAGTLLVPIYGLVFCLDLPILGAAPFSWDFVYGLVIVTVGSLLYNHAKFAGITSALILKVWQGRRGLG